MNILLVKLSSLGDVLHNLPIIWDLRKRYPDSQIDWVVEEAYVPLLEPLRSTAEFRGIDHIIPWAFRRWKRALKNGEFIQSIQEFILFKNELQKSRYDIIIDTQGLIKSAIVAYWANKSVTARIIGLGNKTEYSGYEPIARRFYSEAVMVPTRCHAVDRSRILAATASDLPPPDRLEDPPSFYRANYLDVLMQKMRTASHLSVDQLGFDMGHPYVMCFHSTAGQSKRWPEQSWIKIAQVLSNKGFKVIIPWGTDQEKKVSHQLAGHIPGAIVPAAFSISDAFYLVAGAKLTIGVDTGLTHLAAILACPTIELYCDSPVWKTEGYWSENIINLGDKGEPPTVEQVLMAINQLLG